MNLGNPVERTIGQLAEKVIEITGSRSQMKYKPLPANDPVRRCPDISMAKEIMGWKPSISLEKGLVQTVDYFRQLLPFINPHFLNNN